MKKILAKLQEIYNKYFTIVCLFITMFFFLVGVVAVCSKVTTKEDAKTQADSLYEKGYIDGFREARVNEVSDTLILNHLYPSYELMEKYEPKN